MTETKYRCSRRAIGAAALLLMCAWTSSASAQDGLPYTIEPPQGSVTFGSAVASGGDADGDGGADIFVGDPTFRVDNELVGRWFVYSGRNGTMLWSVTGDQPQPPNSGPRIVGAFIGDVDGDDRDDVAVGFPQLPDGIRALKVYSGADGSIIRESDVVGFRSLCAAGDIDGDLVPDIAYTAYAASGPQEAIVAVQSGATGEVVLRRALTDVPSHIRSLGDVNGDLIPDLIVGFNPLPGSCCYSAVLAISGASGESIWSREESGTGSLGFALATGVDLTGDHVPDVATMLRTGSVGIILNGATGRQGGEFLAPIPDSSWGLRLDFADVNGDGRPEIVSLRWQNLIFGVDAMNHEQRIIHWAQGTPTYPSESNFSGDESAVADVNGDGADDFIIGSFGNGVRVFGGGQLLLNFAQRRDDYDVSPGQSYDFTVGGGQPGRLMHLLGSLTGNGCTFIQQLGLCIDLDRRIYNLGSAVSDVDRVAHFSLTVPLNIPRGPLWLQAIDPADPRRGAIKSNVMRLDVNE